MFDEGDDFLECKVPYFSVVQEIDKMELVKRAEKLDSSLKLQAFNHAMIHHMFSKKEIKKVEV